MSVVKCVVCKCVEDNMYVLGGNPMCDMCLLDIATKKVRVTKCPPRRAYGYGSMQPGYVWPGAERKKPTLDYYDRGGEGFMRKVL